MLSFKVLKELSCSCNIQPFEKSKTSKLYTIFFVRKKVPIQHYKVCWNKCAVSRLWVYFFPKSPKSIYCLYCRP